jgi:ABC-type oligopeptide transport system substrate-binding subunit
MGVGRAQWWRERFIAEEHDEIKRGLIQRRKTITHIPQGVGGLALNTTAWPFDDINVRKAFSYLWDVESLNKNLFFNEYYKKNSWYAFSKYEHPDNPKQYYNPELALELLGQSGWNKKEGEKWLSKNDQTFEIDMYISQGMDRIFNPLVNDLEAIGIKLTLVVIQNPFDKFIDKTYTIHYGGWTGSSSPSPEGMLHSKYADQIDVTNATGMANPEIDKLIEKYNKNWNSDERVTILQSIDSLATREYHYVFGWAGLYGRRGLHWDRFGIPKHGLGYGYERYKKYWGSWGSPILLWWSDPEKKKKLAEAKKSDTITLPIDNELIDYWKILNK